MSYRTERRRRQIAAKGRPMQLMTADKSRSVPLIGYAPPPTAATIDAALPRQTLIVQIMNDALAAAAYGAPCSKDRLIDGDRTYTLTDATGIFDGATLIGWVLIAAGGT